MCYSLIYKNFCFLLFVFFFFWFSWDIASFHFKPCFSTGSFQIGSTRLENTDYIWNSSSDMHCHLHLKSMVQIIISKVQLFFFLFCCAEMPWWSLAQFYSQNVLSLGLLYVAISKNNVGLKVQQRKLTFHDARVLK